MSDYPKLDAAIAALDLDYSATFVPQSKSRNRKDSMPSINWRVRIGAFECDYMQGIAHAPGCSGARRTLEARARAQDAAELGQYSPGHRRRTYARETLPAPLLRDVLHSLILDAGVLDYGCFESWAADYGLDDDSRKAERIYKRAVEQTLALRQVIPQSVLDTLALAFEREGY